MRFSNTQEHFPTVETKTQNSISTSYSIQNHQQMLTTSQSHWVDTNPAVLDHTCTSFFPLTFPSFISKYRHSFLLHRGIHFIWRLCKSIYSFVPQSNHLKTLIQHMEPTGQRIPTLEHNRLVHNHIQLCQVKFVIFFQEADKLLKIQNIYFKNDL